MAKRRRFTPQFKAEVVIEALMGQSSQAENCVGDTTSATNNYRSGNTNCLTMRRFSLNPLISNPTTLSNGLLNWSNWLGD